VFIEKFDLNTRSWQRMGDAMSASTIATRDPVHDYGLYRIAGCSSGDSVGDRCSYTSVYWVPVLPASVYFIPDEVIAGDGTHMIIARDVNLESQTRQYNVYLMAKFAGDLGDELASLPPMTKRRVEVLDFTGDHPTTWQEVIEWYVYREYELARTRCEMSSTGCAFTIHPRAPGLYRDPAYSGDGR
jgi:hypothetical protein